MPLRFTYHPEQRLLLGRGSGRVTGADLADHDGAAAPVQRSLFEPEPDAGSSEQGAQRKKLLQAMDAIRDRHGEGAVRHGGGRRATNPWGPDREDPDRGGSDRAEREA